MKKAEAFLSKFLDDVSEFLAERKGLAPLIGAGMVILNLILDLTLPGSFFSQTDILLQIGIVIAIIGFLLARAL